jgi:hypothetical protein
MFQRQCAKTRKRLRQHSRPILELMSRGHERNRSYALDSIQIVPEIPTCQVLPRQLRLDDVQMNKMLLPTTSRRLLIEQVVHHIFALHTRKSQIALQLCSHSSSLCRLGVKLIYCAGTLHVSLQSFPRHGGELVCSHDTRTWDYLQATPQIHPRQ